MRGKRLTIVKRCCMLGGAALLLLSCAAEPTLYPRIVIDTYKPVDGGFGSADTFITLFGSAGDPDEDITPDLWNDDVSPYTVDAPPDSLSENYANNPVFPTCGRIDYTGGLMSGTYYIRVRCRESTLSGVYALRVVESVDPTVDQDLQYPPAEDWFFASNSDDSAYEPDDDPPSGGRPTNPVDIRIGDKVNRALTAGDVDWFRLILP